MRRNKKIISTVISAVLIMPCFSTASFASDNPFDEDMVRSNAAVIDYGTFDLIFDSDEETRDQWFTFSAPESGYYEIMSCADSYMITPCLTVYNEEFNEIEDGLELNTDEDSPLDFDYVMYLEEGESYYFRIETFTEITNSDYIVCFFPSIAPEYSEESIYVPLGGDLELSYEVTDYDDSHPDYFKFRWADESDNDLGTSSSLVTPVSDTGYVFFYYTYRNCASTRRCIDYCIENNLSSNFKDETWIFMSDPGAEINLTIEVSGDDLNGITYNWYDYFDETESCLGTEPSLTVTNNTNGRIACNAEDRFGNSQYNWAALFVNDPATNIDLSSHNPYNYTFSSSAYYRVFTVNPEVSGLYTFESSGEADLFAALFDSSYTIVDENDDIDQETDNYSFYLSCDLEAGKTYYLAVSGYVDEEKPSQSVSVLMTVPTPSSTGTPTTTSAPVTSTPTSAPTSAPATAAPTSGATATPTSAPSETGVAGFVERLYTVALGRPSDPVGKNEWIEAITMRGTSGGEVARGFLFSNEFLNKDVSNVEFATVLYRTFFDREPDQAGLNGWVNVLDNGVSKQEVIEGFINSTEWANLCLRYGIASGGTGVPNVEVEPNEATIAFATRLYTTCLGREADAEGLMAWARQLANQRDTGTGAARGFFFSSEFINQNVSNGEYVSRLYRTFMGREPDAGGFLAWKEQLDNGVSREEVFNGFAQSSEFTQICATYGIIR